MKESQYRICKKCLLLESYSEESVAASLRQYIERIEPDDKVSDAVYRERLAICRSCDRLSYGMCRICGCYVEMRAAMKKNVCPQVHPLWDRVQDDAYAPWEEE